jgi:hypothetical protein
MGSIKSGQGTGAFNHHKVLPAGERIRRHVLEVRRRLKAPEQRKQIAARKT